MFGTRWRLFRLLGIPISLDASWLIILALLTWTLIDLFREAVPGLPAATYWAMGLAAALTFFTCIVLHEMGHALVARAVGIPIRGITLFLFGGVAEMEEEPPSARSEFLMAIAGPAVSALLSGLFWLLSRLVEAPAVAFPLRYLAGINLAVLIFNLVPAFPLDGAEFNLPMNSRKFRFLRHFRRSQAGAGHHLDQAGKSTLTSTAGCRAPMLLWPECEPATMRWGTRPVEDLICTSVRRWSKTWDWNLTVKKTCCNA